MSKRLAWPIQAAVMVLVSGSFDASAQGLQSPEQCIIDTLKTAPADSAMMVRWNCIRRYINAALPRSTNPPLSLFKQSTIRWYPAGDAFPNPEQERVLLTLKNDSFERVIAVDVVLIDVQSTNEELYRAYADYPIDPQTVGTLEADVITGTSGQSAIQNFWKTHDWRLQAVYGVSP